MNFQWKPGSNCETVEEAERVSVLIDGQNYFKALHQALVRARNSVFILGWDIHSELCLLRGDDASDERNPWPVKLGPLLDQLVKKNHDLHVYILCWDFAMIYSLEREFFPSYKLDWKSHKRVHFCLDGEHPVGGSQHQKIVVIDDTIAFVGGLDLSKWRWDTPKHAPDNSLRVCPDGKPYPPFHDLQMLVEGPIVKAVARLARSRWQKATCEEPVSERPHPSKGHSPWPESAEVWACNLPVALARTLPEHKDQTAAREIERQYLDSIEAAEHRIYLENQYFSSDSVGQALARRLGEKEGPEVIMVMPERTGGWLEQHTMDVLRSRLLRILREADQHDRLRVFGVRLAENPDLWLMIHAKVMIIDDCFARVGSSNLSNRSMGLDSECDLSVYAAENRAAAGFALRLRRELLAEHLGISVKVLEQAEEEHPTLIKAIDALRRGERTLVPLSTDVAEAVDELIPDAEVIDPEKPLEPEEFLKRIVPSAQPSSFLKRSASTIGLIFTVLVLGLAWRFTDLSEWLSVERIEQLGHQIKALPFTPVWVIAAFIAGGLLAVPVTLLIVATVSVFGAWAGMAYSLAGAELSALVCYAVGHVMGRDSVGRLAGSRVNRLIQALANRGLLTVITLRILPVAPFSVINVVAGVSPIRFRDFALGSLLGLLPGIIAIALMADQVLASLKNPDPVTLIVAVVIISAVLLGLHLLKGQIKKSKGRRND